MLASNTLPVAVRERKTSAAGGAAATTGAAAGGDANDRGVGRNRDERTLNQFDLVDDDRG